MRYFLREETRVNRLNTIGCIDLAAARHTDRDSAEETIGGVCRAQKGDETAHADGVQEGEGRVADAAAEGEVKAETGV